MGYYSFYRIFKDIIKTIFGSKFWRITLIVLIIFVMFFLLFPKTSSAFSVEKDGYTVNFSDNLENYDYIYTILQYPTNKVHVACYLFPKGSNVKVSFANNFFTFLCDKYCYLSGQYTQTQLNGLQIGSTIRDVDFTSGSTGGSMTDTSLTARNNIIKNPVGANFDLYDTNCNLIFQGTPAYTNPIFYNKSSFQDFSADSLIIYPNDYGVSNTLYLHFLTVDNTVSDDTYSYYYYSQRIFALNSSSQYLNSANGVFYYNIPRSVFALEANKQYLFFLSDTDTSINYTVGFYDISEDFDGFSLTPTDSQVPVGSTIIDNQQNQNNQLNDINNFLNDYTVSDNTNNDINNSLQFDVSNDATNFVTSFFSNLSDLFVGLSDYNLNEVTTIDLPVPFTNSVLSLRSDLLSSHLDTNLIQIITLFWYFLFGMYYIKFMISISKSITTGDAIVGTVKVPEVITDDVL